MDNARYQRCKFVMAQADELGIELKTPENYSHIANDRISSHSKSVNSDCVRIRSTW
jgi:hypothetical protein